MSRLSFILLITAGSATAAAAQEVEFFAHRGSSTLIHLESTDGLGLAGCVGDALEMGVLCLHLLRDYSFPVAPP